MCPRHFALVLTFAVGLLAANSQEQWAQVFAQNAPAIADYTCPMHPDVRSRTTGTCPRCGMSLVVRQAVSDDYALEVSMVPRAPRPGRPVQLKFAVRQGLERVRKFADTHERPFHVFIVSDDLQYFDHVHPALQPDGTLLVETVLPYHARYQLYADFVPTDGAPQFIPYSVYTAGPARDPAGERAPLGPDLGPKQAGGTSVDLQLPPGAGLVAGELQGFRFHFTDAMSGAPVKNLEPYLGASAHLLVVSEDVVDGLHGHPSAEFSSTSGPDVVFEALFPRPGLHRVWIQFKRGGRVEVASFVVPVSPAPFR